MNFTRMFYPKTDEEREERYRFIIQKMKKMEDRLKRENVITVNEVLKELDLRRTSESLYYGWTRESSRDHIFMDTYTDPEFGFIVLIFYAENLTHLLMHE